MDKIRAGIVGAAGFTGGELIRILLYHPQAEIVFAASRSHTGHKITEIHKDLEGDTGMAFTEVNGDADVVFLCLPHRQSKPWLENNPLPAATKIIDLGNDFRIENRLAERTFVYGLPELYKNNIRGASSVANPGCFATAIQLALLPLAAGNLPDEVYVTGITGSTGAGKELVETTGFTWRVNNISAYKTLTHQHLGEMAHILGNVSGKNITLNFVPWRGDFARGIFTSSVIETEIPLEELYDLYESYYSDHPFTHVSRSPINLKQAVNTNKCLLSLEKSGNKLVVHSAIDNLLKGASGQAVQNMNLMFGLDETVGLRLKPSVF
jgi:N-acetyl-gamma-glutamyl-phosphate reductase